MVAGTSQGDDGRVAAADEGLLKAQDVAQDVAQAVLRIVLRPDHASEQSGQDSATDFWH